MENLTSLSLSLLLLLLLFLYSVAVKKEPNMRWIVQQDSKGNRIGENNQPSVHSNYETFPLACDPDY